MRKIGSIFGQPYQLVEIAVNQRLLLGPAPPFELPLGGDRIGNAIEILRKDQLNWPTRLRETTEGSGVMFIHTAFQAPSRRANIIPAVVASQKVNERFHATFQPTSS